MHCQILNPKRTSVNATSAETQHRHFSGVHPRSFYSIDMLPPIWQKITLFNPVVYLISGFRWSFFGVSDVSVGVSVAMALVFLALCLGTVWWMFRTGYRLKN